jgi:hypothetical protein
VLTKEQSFTRAAIHELLIWNAEDFHDAGELFLLILARKYRETSVQLSQDTAQTPHVNGHVVVHTEDNFGGSIKTALNVSVD